MKALANGTFLKTYPSKWLDVKVPLMFYERIEEIKKKKGRKGIRRRRRRKDIILAMVTSRSGTLESKDRRLERRDWQRN